MGRHLHKNFNDDFIKSLFQKYLMKQLSVNQILEILKVKRRRFFILLKEFKNDTDNFSIIYQRKSQKRISQELENIILKELALDKKLIQDKNIPLYSYNYSYIKHRIEDKYNLKVSSPTIIKRAKEHDFYIPKKQRKKHDREVLTNYPGELIQHDSSHHLFAPYAGEKWYLITSIDDYSRYILYAKFLKKETTWAHIMALESTISRYGIPLKYYVDCHSIFRFVQGRDSVWRNHRKLTDQATPQFKQVLNDLHIDIIYALSPQAKGKVERPYQWMQDRIIRTCARENVRDIIRGQNILASEIDRYNNRQKHSTTDEIPVIRFQKAIRKNQSLFREYKIPAPYQNSKDIFCLRDKRIVDAYHKISVKNQELRIKEVPLREQVEIRIVPDLQKGVSELRFWYRNKLVDTHIMKNSDLDIVQF